MTKPRLKKKTASKVADDARSMGRTVMGSAQQIWLAGLGAFAKAQQEGGKLFDSLVREGAALDAKTRKFTEAKVNEARGNVEQTLGQIRERSQDTWDRLEKVFEDRVSKALGRLGVPTRNEVDALRKRIDELAGTGRGKTTRTATPRRAAAAKKRTAAPATGKRKTR